MRKFILFILILGLLVAILGYYYYQRNIYSKEVLRLEILGPAQVNAFEEVEYLVKYKNNGNITLEEPVLIFQYPKNSLIIDEESERVIKTLEDIYPGEERTISFKGRLLGRENEAKQAEVLLRYRPKNLRAFYESKTTFTTKIESLPLTFELDIPSRTEAGKEEQIFLNYFSNSDWPLSNLRIEIEYPSGFEFIKSIPAALEKTEWELPLLNRAEGGRIEIRGKLLGQVREQKIFRASLGLWKEGEFVLLTEIFKGTEIAKPALYVFQQINGESQYVANPGDVLHYEIFFRNIGQEPFQELFLVSRLEGDIFDFATLKSEFGQFNPGDNFIIWDWREVPKMRFLDQAEEGKVEFWINLKKDWQITSSKDKNLSLTNRITLSQVREEFVTKVNSKLEISQKGYFADEVFGNTGYIPPKVGEITTYTIIWQAKNYYNEVRDVKVKTFLPLGVKLTGKIFPEEARLTFDSQSREIVWTIDDMAAGVGILEPSASVSFQIALLPSVFQTGKAAELVSQAVISGEDSWTKAVLTATSPLIDTSLPDDKSITEQMGIVQ